MAQGKFTFGIGFNVDKSGLNTIQSEFQKIARMSQESLKLKGIDISAEELKKLQTEASELATIFAKSYNFKLNSVDVEKLGQNLKESGKTLENFEAELLKLGPVGQQSFHSINTVLNKTQTLLKETHPLLDKMKETFANTIRWSIASKAIDTVTSSIQKAWSFTKELDTSLNDIRIVTGKSAEEMETFAVKANKAAKALGASTKSYSQAALIYYQQGLSEEDVQARATVTTKAANVTGQSAREVSEQLTAVWNGYKVSAAEAELYIDKLSAVAATTAADLEELSTGMSKVASAANIMGVDIDQLNAQLATIVSVTREAPESIGTALKTVYARMSDIEAGLDGETSLSEYTQQMEKMGVNALDASGNLRSMGEIVEEIGDKWSQLSRNQQVSLAQTIAGTRQYSRMMALFDNWDMYNEAKATSTGAAGTLAKQNEIALDSLDKKLEKLSATTETMYLALFDNESIKNLIDGLTKIVELTAQFVKNIGGARTLLLGLGAAGLNLLSDKAGAAVGKAIVNRQHNKEAKTQRNRMNQQELLARDVLSEEEYAQRKQREADIVAEGIKVKQIELEINAIRTSAKEKEDNLNQEYAQKRQELLDKELQAVKNKNEEELRSYENLIKKKEALDNSVTKDAEIETITEATIQRQLKNNFSLATASEQDIIDAQIALAAKDKEYAQHAKAFKKIGDEQDSYSMADVSAIQQEIDYIEEFDDLSTEVRQAIEKAFQEFREAVSSGDIEKANEEKRKISAAGEAALKAERDANKDAIKALEKPERKARDERRKQKADEQEIKRFEEASAKKNEILNQSETELLEQAKENIQEKDKLLEEAHTKEINRLTEQEKDQVDLLEAQKNASETFINTAQTDQNIEDQRIKTQALTSNIMELTSGLVMLGTSISTLAALPDIIDNKDLDAGEKASAIISTVIPALLAATSGVMTFVSTGPAVMTTLTGISFSAKTAGESFEVLGKKALSALVKILPYAAPIIAIIAALGAAAKIAEEIGQEEEKAAQKATEAVQRQQKIVANLNQEYEKLSSSLDRIDSLYDSIADLTEGSLEWKQAVADVNSEVLDLISKYPELAKEVKNVNGVMTLSANALEQFQEKQLQQLQQAKAVSYMNNKESRDANYELLKENFVEANRGVSADSDALIGAGVGTGVGLATAGAFAAAGATIGSVAPVIGTLIGGAIGAASGLLVGGITQLLSDAEEDRQMAELENNKDIKAVLDLYASGMANGMFDSVEAFEATLKAHDIPLNDNTRALIENAEQTKALAEAYRNNKSTDYYEAIELGKAALGEGKTDLEYYEAGQDINRLASIKETTVANRYDGGNDKDEELLRKYLRFSGINPDTAEINSKGDNRLQYKDNEGKTHDVSVEEIVKQVAKYEAIESYSKSGRKPRSSSEDISRVLNSTEASNAFSSVVQGISGLENVSYDAVLALQKLTQHEELLASYSEDASSKLNEALEAVTEARNNIWSNKDAQAQFKSYSNVNLNGLSTAEYESFAQQYEELYKYYSDGATKGLMEALSLAGTNASALAQDIFVNIDWTAVADPSKEMISLLEKYGIEASYGLEEALTLTGYALADTIPPISIVYDSIANVKKLSEALARSNIISAETYEKLSAKSKKYFTILEDGTAKLLTSASLVVETERESAKNTAKANVEAAKASLNKATDKAKEEHQKNKEDIKKTRKAEQQEQQEAREEVSDIADKYDSKWDVAIGVFTGDSFVDGLAAVGSTSSAIANSDKAIERRYKNSMAAEDARYEAALQEAEKKDAEALETYYDYVEAYARTLTFKEFNPETDEILKVLYDTDKDKYNEILQNKQLAMMSETGVLDGLMVGAEDELRNAFKKLQVSEIIEEFTDSIHTLELSLNKNNQAVDRLADEYDRLTGKAKVENLKKQNELLEDNLNIISKQFDAFKMKEGSILQANVSNYTDNLSKLTNLGLTGSKELKGLSFTNTDGSINEESIQKFETWYSENAFTIAQNEALQAETQAIFDALDAYATEYENKVNALTNAERELIEKRIENFRVGFEIKIDEKKFEQEWAEFAAGLGNISISNLSLQMTKSMDSLVEQARVSINEFQEFINQEGLNLSLNDQIVEQQNTLNKLQDYHAQVKEKISSMEEYINNLYSQRIEYQDQIIELIEKEVTLNQLLYGEDKYATYLTLDKAKLDAYTELTHTVEEQAKADLAKIQDYTGDKTSEEYMNLVNAANKSSAVWAGAVESEIQATLDYYESFIDSQFADFEQELSGGRTREDWERERDWNRSVDERWLNEKEAIYEIRDAELSYEKAIAKATESQKKALEKIKVDQMAILNAKKAAGTLQQADVERSQKVLELEQARLALEDARNNKSKLRLTRGADGTYGFSYATDESSILAAESAVNSAEKNLYEFDKDREKESVDEVYDLYQTYLERRREYGANGLTDEELAELKMIEEELQKVSDNAMSVLSEDNTGGLAELVRQLANGGVEGSLGAYTDAMDKEWEDVGKRIEDIRASLDPEKEGSLTSHMATMKAIAEDAGKAVADFMDPDNEKFQAFLNNIKQMSDVFNALTLAIEGSYKNIIEMQKINNGDFNLDGKVDNEADKTAFNEMLAKGDYRAEQYAIDKGWYSKDASAYEKGKALIAQGYDISQAPWYEEYAKKKTEISEAANTFSGLWAGMGSIGNIFSKNKDDESNTGSIGKTITGLFNTFSDYLKESAKNDAKNSAETIKESTLGVVDKVTSLFAWPTSEEEEKEEEEKIFKSIDGIFSSVFGVFSKKNSMDTGGYTGTWGTEGKLAVLHQKELVLNQEDTKNILSSVELMRNISSTLKNSTNSQIGSLLGLLGAEKNIAAMNDSQSPVIEQKVEIKAEFPNARDTESIMEAFDNLINLASQHAYKRK